MIQNAVWLVVVRFDPVAAADEFDRLGAGSDWLLFDAELANEKGERT